MSVEPNREIVSIAESLLTIITRVLVAMPERPTNSGMKELMFNLINNGVNTLTPEQVLCLSESLKVLSNEIFTSSQE